MSQKFIKSQNKNPESVAYGKYYAQAVYDSKFIETEDLADYIQSQASVKRSDIIAVLTELGEAMKHYFELGQKVHLTGIGIFKVGFSSIGVAKKEDCEQERQGEAEVRRGQDPHQGCGLRGDPRQRRERRHLHRLRRLTP